MTNEQAEPHYEISIWIDGSIGDAAYEAMFARVADAAHDFDEPVTCAGSIIR